MPIIRGNTSRGVVIWGLYETLLHAESVAIGAQRRRLKEHREALKAAYPELLRTTPSDVEQYLAEEEGDALEDTI